MIEIKLFLNDSPTNEIVPRTHAFKWRWTVTIIRAIWRSRLRHVTCALIKLILRINKEILNSIKFIKNSEKFRKNLKKSLKIRKFMSFKIKFQINPNLFHWIRNWIIYAFKKLNLINKNRFNFYLKNTLISLRF